MLRALQARLRGRAPRLVRAGRLLAATPRFLRRLGSQYWSPERAQAQQCHQLAAILDAAARIPFYAERLGRSPRPEELSGLPILRRADVLELNASVRSLYPPGKHFPADRSSGSTGMPVEFLFDATHQRGRFAARARYLLANGWNPLRRNAWIVFLAIDGPDGELVARNSLLGARLLSHLTPFEEQARWLEALDPVSLYTFPSNLEGLLPVIEARGTKLRSLERLFSGSEVLDDTLRERVRRTLGVETADNYGSTEAFLAWQCPAGSYHVNSEHALIEIVDDRGAPVEPGGIGRVLVTTLENRLMPLVRYEIGDYAHRATGRCPCGRTLPLIGAVAGRAINLFHGRDGSRFTPWTLIAPLKNRPAIRQFQLVQRSYLDYVVRFVAADPLGAETEAAIASEMGAILGQAVQVRFERRGSIARGATGKYLTALREPS
jgi:phenylacetate-CoA ligase